VEIAKVLEILSKHIIKIEEDNQLKDWEIRSLKEKLKKVEDHLDSYYETKD
jgi:hypothetical protein